MLLSLLSMKWSCPLQNIHGKGANFTILVNDKLRDVCFSVYLP